MLEQKLRLKNAIRDNEPKKRVSQFFDEYEEAYKRLHKPSDKHTQDYITLYFDYLEYMNKK